MLASARFIVHLLWLGIFLSLPGLSIAEEQKAKSKDVVVWSSFDFSKSYWLLFSIKDKEFEGIKGKDVRTYINLSTISIKDSYRFLYSRIVLPAGTIAANGTVLNQEESMGVEFQFDCKNNAVRPIRGHLIANGGIYRNLEQTLTRPYEKNIHPKSEKGRMLEILCSSNNVNDIRTGFYNNAFSPPDGSLPLTNIDPSGYSDSKLVENGLYEWNNGDVYDGPLLGGIPNGRGRIQSLDGRVYEGDIANGVVNGKGKLTSKNGLIYIGEFVSGRASGVGRVRYSNGDQYEGELIDLVPNGKGIYLESREKLLFDGSFKDKSFQTGRIKSIDGRNLATVIDGRVTGSVQQKSTSSLLNDLLGVVAVVARAYSTAKRSSYQAYMDLNQSGLVDSVIDDDEPLKVDFDSEKMGGWRSKPREIVPLVSDRDYSLESISSGSKGTDIRKSSGCSSDYDCGVGFTCVKRMYSSSGSCMQSADRSGTRIYNTPNPSSIGVKTKGECSFNTDCPIGFYCDGQSKACVRK